MLNQIQTANDSYLAPIDRIPVTGVEDFICLGNLNRNYPCPPAPLYESECFAAGMSVALQEAHMREGAAEFVIPFQGGMRDVGSLNLTLAVSQTQLGRSNSGNVGGNNGNGGVGNGNNRANGGSGRRRGSRSGAEIWYEQNRTREWMRQRASNRQEINLAHQNRQIVRRLNEEILNNENGRWNDVFEEMSPDLQPRQGRGLYSNRRFVFQCCGQFWIAILETSKLVLIIEREEERFALIRILIVFIL